jgi:hypothetical protein
MNKTLFTPRHAKEISDAYSEVMLEYLVLRDLKKDKEWTLEECFKAMYYQYTLYGFNILLGVIISEDTASKLRELGFEVSGNGDYKIVVNRFIQDVEVKEGVMYLSL